MWIERPTSCTCYELGEWDELLRESDGSCAGIASTEARRSRSSRSRLVLRSSRSGADVDEAARDAAIFLPRSREIGDPQAVGPALVQAALVSALEGDSTKQ